MADSGRLDELQRKFNENPRRYFAPLASEFRKGGDPERAIALCRTYLSEQPGHMSGYIVYGQALFDAGQRHEAAEAFERSLALDPENVIAMRYLGDIARNAGDLEGAAKWYRKLLDLDPKDEVLSAYLTELTIPVPAAAVIPPLSNEPRRPMEGASAVEVPLLTEALHPEELLRPPELLPVETISPAPLFEEIYTLEEAFPSEAVLSPKARLELPPEEEALAWVEMAEASAYMPELPSITEFTPSPSPSEPEEEAGPIPEGVSAPFVTETMAALYLQQGFVAKALEVYRQLSVLRPEPRLQERVRELEQALATETVSVRDFFVRIGARRPAAVVAPSTPSSADSGGGGVAALFAGALPDMRDEHAAAALAGAYATPR